jgi:hypothetical protein
MRQDKLSRETKKWNYWSGGVFGSLSVVDTMPLLPAISTDLCSQCNIRPRLEQRPALDRLVHLPSTNGPNATQQINGDFEHE